MSAVEETKPVTAETPAAPAAVESTPAADVEKSLETPAAATETPATTTTAEPTSAADVEKSLETPAETTAAAATTETPAVVEEKKEEKKVEPIYSGQLGYKVHHAGFDIKSMISGPKKRFFWFGEEAPITSQNLNTFLRGEKPKVAHPAAAWSSKTGKGLLYFVKHEADKASPAGVLVLADATDVTEPAGLPEFSFKLDGAKHTFETKTKDEASGWVLALKEKIEEAKSIKEEVHSSTEYKDASSHLNKPVTAGLAAAGAAGVAAKKEEKKEDKEEAAVEKAEEKEAKKEEKENKKPKSRSVSRGNKRQSIFGSLIGKKDEVEEKVKEKKEEKEEAKEAKKAEKEEAKEAKEEEEAVAPVAAAETPVAATEPKTEEISAAPVAETAPATAEPTEAAATETKPAEETAAAPTKAGKRGSIFGNFFEKVRSPTHEKKEAEVAPVVPPKDETKDKELPAAPEEGEAVVPPPVVAPVAEPTATDAAAPAEETKAEEKTAPQTERKGSFFGKLKNDFQKLRSPSSERTPVVASEAKEEPKEETAPAVLPLTEEAPATEATPAATEPATEEAAPVTEEPKTEAVNGVEKKEETTPEKRRTSFFGGSKKTEGGESTGQKLGGLLRNPSKLIRSNKEGKKAAAPSKVEEEETKVSDEAPKLEEPKPEAPLDAKPEEPNQTQSIGDVVPAAVQVGQPQSTPAVSAAA